MRRRYLNVFRRRRIADTIQAVPEAALQEQRAAYNALLQSLGSASFDQIEDALAARDTAEPEDGLTPEIIARLRDKISQQ